MVRCFVQPHVRIEWWQRNQVLGRHCASELFRKVGGYKPRLTQYPQGTERDVLEVAYGSRDYVQVWHRKYQKNSVFCILSREAVI